MFTPDPIPWTPRQYQLNAVKFLLGRGAAGNLAFPGAGKTSVTFSALCELKRRGTLGKVLLIAPLRVVYSVWRQEAQKWTQFTHLSFSILHGSNKDQALQADADIYLINPEGLQWLLSDMKRFRSTKFDALIVDELSKFKHPNTRRFKLLKTVLGTFSLRWGLTGSPASNGLGDLFGQCFVLDQGRSLGPYITHFRSKYFVPTGFQGYEWKLRPGADKEIYERIAPLCTVLQADDANLNLPTLVNNVIRVDLPPDAMKVYKQMEAVLIAQIKEGTVVAANAAAASSKCRQIANGGVYYEGEERERKISQIHDEKTAALGDLVEELQGNPLLIAYEFLHDLGRIRTALGDSIPFIGGGVPAKRGSEIIAQWNRGEIPVLLAHPATLAHGVNLQQVGHHICWYSLPWDLEWYLQFNARIWRQGNKAKRVFVHHIVARGTIDEVVLKVLEQKEKTQTALFDALKLLGQGE